MGEQRKMPILEARKIARIIERPTLLEVIKKKMNAPSRRMKVTWNLDEIDQEILTDLMEESVRSDKKKDVHDQ